MSVEFLANFAKFIYCLLFLKGVILLNFLDYYFLLINEKNVILTE